MPAPVRRSPSHCLDPSQRRAPLPIGSSTSRSRTSPSGTSAMRAGSVQGPQALLRVGPEDDRAARKSDRADNREGDQERAAHASAGLVLSGFLVMAQFALFLFLGTLLWAHYAGRPFARGDEVLPTFVSTELPGGWTGFILAAVVAIEHMAGRGDA